MSVVGKSEQHNGSILFLNFLLLLKNNNSANAPEWVILKNL